MSRTVLITGVSKGIGLATATILLVTSFMYSPKLFRMSTKRKWLELQDRQKIQQVQAIFYFAISALRKEYPDRFLYIQGDVAKNEVQQRALDAAQNLGGLDSLVLNAEFDGMKTNLFSLVSLVQLTIPSIREKRGSIIFVSSGAATKSYAAWGAYGASKAALNHLCGTLGVEEQSITSISVRPGVVDSEMQREIREAGQQMSHVDQKRFHALFEGGELLSPTVPGWSLVYPSRSTVQVEYLPRWL
ncbi:hypothetical protein PROFUN_06425 [Planoprotostelium fungivorum]|uniref:Uncharacterized protein n=1 Tax=Planoprotostelium fungivorum TaxID=1890364 RepID=A0A2P6NNW7_9EUKA|nr:hypothetical protein PROFUN_06425 [Planoprotostelium fungivorum]